MNPSKKFRMEIMVYPFAGTKAHGKNTFTNVEADCESRARRKVLEQSWAMGFCVDRFITISERSIK